MYADLPLLKRQHLLIKVSKWVTLNSKSNPNNQEEKQPKITPKMPESSSWLETIVYLMLLPILLYLAAFVVAFLLVSFIAYLCLLGIFWATFGYFIARGRKNLEKAFGTINNLIFDAQSILREQYSTYDSYVVTSGEIQSSADSALNQTKKNKDLFLGKYKTLSSRVSEITEDLSIVVSCNRNCSLPEARERILYLEERMKELSSPLALIEGEVSGRTKEDIQGFDELKLNLTKKNVSLESIKQKSLCIADDLQSLHSKWSVSIADAPLGVFNDLPKDVEQLVSLVRSAADLQRELVSYGTSLSELEFNLYMFKLFLAWREKLTRLEKLVDDLEQLQKSPDSTAAGFFGGRNVEWGEWPRHVVVAGASRAGKSLTIEMLMSPILKAILKACRDIKRQRSIRSVIFDVDGKTVTQLEQIGFHQGEYIILNPYDTRRWGWATGKDVVDHDDILALIEVLLPIDNKKQGNDAAYWIPLGRSLILCAIHYLIDLRANEWTLWDIFDVIFYNLNERERLFDCNPSLKEQLYLDTKNPNHKHFRTVLNTIQSALAEVEGFAALWHEASNQLSIRDFLGTSGVLVIPEHGVKAKEALRKINTFILEMIGMFGIDEGILPENQHPNTWIVVDEATRIAPIPRFDDFLTNGLKRGISVIFGFQSYNKAQAGFGEYDLEAILEQCTMTALLRLDGQSAEWASEKCRSYWGEIISITLSEGFQEGRSTQRTEGTSEQSSEGSSHQSTRGSSEQKTRAKVWGDSFSTSESTSEGTNEGESEGTNSSTSQGKNTSDSVGENSSTSTNISVQVSPQKLKRIEPGDFAHFPEISLETGLTGVFLMRDLRTKAQSFASQLTLDWRLVRQALISNADGQEVTEKYRVAPDYTRQLLKKLKGTQLNDQP